jgi:hypothetical protein
LEFRIPEEKLTMAGNATRTSAAALPDLNAETYPYDFVQHLLDETADANLLLVPQLGAAESVVLTPQKGDYFGLNGGYGIAVRSDLRRFESIAESGSGDRRVLVRQTAGESVGSLRSLWLFGPADLAWAPGEYPAPVIMDPWRSQRFAMLDTHFEFGDRHGFSGYGIGRTFPTTVGGEPKVMVGAVGNVMEGRGRFDGLNGTFVMTGNLVDLGFLGNVTFRFIDPDGVIRTEREIEPPSASADPDRDFSYIVLRGVKKSSSVKTVYGPPPGDDRVNLVTPSIMRSAQYIFDSSGRGPRSGMSVGPLVANMEAEVLFNLLAPSGTAKTPVPFTTKETYSFQEGGRTTGVINTGVVDGVAFQLDFRDAPGQPGVRFAGFGPITGGTGPFEGVEGMLTVNSTIGISPHALSLIHVLAIADPGGGFRGGR